jgi:hypothetical protein
LLSLLNTSALAGRCPSWALRRIVLIEFIAPEAFLKLLTFRLDRLIIGGSAYNKDLSIGALGV